MGNFLGYFNNAGESIRFLNRSGRESVEGMDLKYEQNEQYLMDAWIWPSGDGINNSTPISGFGERQMRYPSLKQGLKRVVHQISWRN